MHPWSLIGWDIFDFSSELRPLNGIWYLIHATHVRYSCWEEEHYLFWVTESKFKFNLGTSTVSVKPCGHNTDYSFGPITSKLHKQVLGEERKHHDFGLRSQSSRSTFALILWLWHLVVDCFLPNHFQILHASCSCREVEPYCFSSRVKVIIYTLLKFCPITSKPPPMKAAHNKRNPIDYESWGQWSRLTLNKFRRNALLLLISSRGSKVTVKLSTHANGTFWAQF